MPGLGFILPHWLYWAGLLLFPIFALLMVRRELARGGAPAVSLAVAYLFLVCGGFAGLHRLYLRNMLGLLYLPLLAAIVFGNAEVRDLRETLSTSRADVQSLERVVHREEGAVARNRSGARERLAAASTQLQQAQAVLDEAQARSDRWHRGTGVVALVMLGGLLIDVVLLPGLVRRTRRREEGRGGPALVPPVPLPDEDRPDRSGARSGARPLARAIDRLTLWVGHFVAFWTVIAVFVYYYEVFARFLFNSPTNWAHESMFLMFGMQYLLCGAYALRTGSHVRVDVFYVKMPPRARAVADVLTAFFFFAFVLTLLGTGWRFAADAVAVGEASFSEWGIQYWVVKLSIPVGAVLLLLQGLAHLLRDIELALGAAPPASGAAPAGLGGPGKAHGEGV